MVEGLVTFAVAMIAVRALVATRGGGLLTRRKAAACSRGARRRTEAANPSGLV